MVKLRLAEMLKKRKLSKRKFAKLINERYSHVFRFFKDDYDPRLSYLEKWAQALNCKIKDLYKEE